MLGRKMMETRLSLVRLRRGLDAKQKRRGYLGAALSLGCAGDEGCGVGGSEAVVDVDDADVGRAGVEHAEQSGCTGEGGSVADRGGDGDDGNGDEAADDAGQSAFHSGTDDDGVGSGEDVALGEQAMDAGDADVVEARDLCAKEFGGDGCFFGGREIAGPGTEDGDVAVRVGWGRLAEGEGAGVLVILRCGSGGEDGCCGGLVGAGGEDVDAGGGHAGEDLGGVLGRLACGVDDFGQAVAEGAMVIDLGVVEVFEGEVGEASGGLLGREGAALDFGQKFEKGSFVHFDLLE